MNEVLQTISNIGIVPVIAIDDASKAVPLARALAAGGLPAAEVTFRTAAAKDAIRAIAKEVPEMLVGAGTVITPEQLDRALAAGSRFIVSPGFNPELVKYGLSKGALMVPGTATGGEMEQAMALGLDVVKFFPAEQNGGIAKLKNAEMDAHRRREHQEPDGLPVLPPDRRLRRHLDGEEGPHRRGEVGRDHRHLQGGREDDAGLFPGPCGNQLRE